MSVFNGLTSLSIGIMSIILIMLIEEVDSLKHHIHDENGDVIYLEVD